MVKVKVSTAAEDCQDSIDNLSLFWYVMEVLLIPFDGEFMFMVLRLRVIGLAK